MIEKSNKIKASKLIHIIMTSLTCVVSVGILLVIILMLFSILKNGITKIDLNFLVALPDEIEEGGGIGPVLFNAFYVLILSLTISVPIGIGAGICLAEYAPNNKITQFIRMCVEALASVPSIVFGLFGMALFVDYFQIGLTILGASVALAFLNLPVITRVTEESITAVPAEIREGAYAMGATKFQCIKTVILPTALSGIITGISLVVGRAFGESAVIILAGGTSTSGKLMDFNLFSPGGTLAVHLWYVQSEAIVPDAREIAEKSAAVLVFIVLIINLLLKMPVKIRQRRMGA